jgi:hypothetical protein
MHSNNDLHNSIRAVRGISPIAIGTTGTGKTSKVIDRQGYGGVEFVLDFGTITSTAAVFSVTVLEGDTTGALTSAADKDLLGTEALAGVGAANPRTSGDSMNCARRIGYIGSKRYVACKIVSTATAGTPISCDAILFNPAVAPTANP